MVVYILMRPIEVAEYNEDMEIELEAERQKQLNPGKVIRKKSIPLKILTSDEAVMKMELSGDPFLIYKGEEDQKLKVIYRTKDGNYGVIRTE